MPEDTRVGAAEPSGPKTDPNERTVIDAAADLLQTIVDWLRQEAEGLVRDKVTLPLQRLGFTLLAAWAATTLMVVGLLMVAIASLLWLAEWLTWPWALFAIGMTAFVGSAIAYSLRRYLEQK